MANDPLDVAVVAYDGLCTFEFGIAIELFALPRPELGGWYRTTVVAESIGPLAATGGVSVVPGAGLDALGEAGTVVVPGWTGPPSPAVVDAMLTAHGRGARIMTICSGVFLLAATGLLDGRRATTHWRYLDRLAAERPAIRLEPDVLYVDEGELLTSAGSAAGIDCGLHLVRRDHGADVANQVARRLVVPPHRDGGQRQFVPEPVAPAGPDAAIAEICEWAVEHLDAPLTVARLAERAGWSPRTFARRFGEATGTSPKRWLAEQRVLAARRLLETSSASVEEIATLVGFGSATTLRDRMRASIGTTPTAYRRRFSRHATQRGAGRGGVGVGPRPARRAERSREAAEGSAVG
ncbi:MAG: transcriptional regulator FtrA [Actinomycetota bacterium]